MLFGFGKYLATALVIQQVGVCCNIDLGIVSVGVFVNCNGNGNESDDEADESDLDNEDHNGDNFFGSPFEDGMFIFFKLLSDRAALVSGISDKRPMRYHRKFQRVVSLKFCRSFVLSWLQTIRETSARREKYVKHDTRLKVISYFLCCFMRQISRVSHLEMSHGRSGNYAQDKGIFWCHKG